MQFRPFCRKTIRTGAIRGGQGRARQHMFRDSLALILRCDS
jgi:hypothetical protein